MKHCKATPGSFATIFTNQTKPYGDHKSDDALSTTQRSETCNPPKVPWFADELRWEIGRLWINIIVPWRKYHSRCTVLQRWVQTWTLDRLRCNASLHKKQTIQFVRMQFHARKPFLEKRWPYFYSPNQTIQQFRTCLLHCSLHFQVSREISAGAYRSSRRGSFVCTPVHTF